MKDFDQFNWSLVVYKFHELQQKVHKRVLQESNFTHEFNEEKYIMKIKLESKKSISEI